MPKRYALTIEVDTLAELVDVAALLGARAQGAQAPVTAPSVDSTGNPSCSAGHGAMRLIPAGVARSGPRMGQAYPAFLKCETCGERRELSA